jgi:hypothetical protein
MMSVRWVKTDLRCERRDLILTRIAYDHRRMRPLMVGVVKSLGYYLRGPVGLVHRQKVRFFSEEKPHFSGRKLQDGLSAQARHKWP